MTSDVWAETDYIGSDILFFEFIYCFAEDVIDNRFIKHRKLMISNFVNTQTPLVGSINQMVFRDDGHQNQVLSARITYFQYSKSQCDFSTRWQYAKLELGELRSQSDARFPSSLPEI